MRRRLFLATIENSVTETGTALAALPVELHPIPVSRIVPCAEEQQIAAVAANLSHFDWVFFTSANAVALFFDLIHTQPRRIACVGPDTAAAVERLGYKVDFVATEHRGNAFADEFVQQYGTPPPSVLLPRPEKMGSQLVEILGLAGISVSEWIIYRTESIPPEELPDLRLTDADLFAFLSPSGVRNFCAHYPLPAGATTFAIGPTTAAAIERTGHSRIRVADDSCRNGLVDAISRFLDNDRDKMEVTT